MPLGSQVTSVRASADSSARKTRFEGVASGAFESPPRLPRVECILSYSKGFICAGGVGLLHLFEKSDDVRENFKRKVVKVNNLPEMSLSLAAKAQSVPMLSGLLQCNYFTYRYTELLICLYALYLS